MKARGDGLGFDLGKAEFRFSERDRNSAGVLIEGRPQPRCAPCSITRVSQTMLMRTAMGVDLEQCWSRHGRAGPVWCRWRFTLQELGKGHWVSVARGPPEDIVDAWQVLQAHACM